ncbi:MAG TPA: VPDSG-CTERM sorting domain-containing protein [Lacunisphaera sp.]
MLPLAGAAAVLAAVYIGVYHATKTLETTAGIKLALLDANKGTSPAGNPQFGISAAANGKDGKIDLFGEELKPREIRRNSGNWRRSLAAFEGELGLGGDDHGAVGSTDDTGKNGSNVQASSRFRRRNSAARGAASFGGGGGSGGGGGGMGLGSGSNGNEGPLDFFLDPDGDRDLPRIVILPSDFPGSGNPTSNGSDNPDVGANPIVVVADNGNQIVSLDPNFPGKNSFVGPPVQQDDESATGPDSSDTDEDPSHPRQDPPSDDHTTHKVPDTASTLGLIAFSMLGLAGLRRRIAR